MKNCFIPLLGIRKPQSEFEPSCFGLRFEPVFRFGNKGERSRIGHHAVGEPRQQTGSGGLIRVRHPHRARDAADVGFPDAGFGQGGMNAEFGERLSSGTVDREVRGVRAVAESAAGGVFQEFGEDVSLTDVAAVFAGCSQFRDSQRVGGDDGNRETHVAGVLDGSFAFGRSHVGAGNVQQHHAIA